MNTNRHTAQLLHLTLLTLTVCLLFVSGLRAQTEVNLISGEATLRLTDNISRDQAKQLVEEEAIANALRNAYGTRIARNVFTRMQANDQGDQYVEQTLQAESMIQGEWLETTSSKVKEFTEKNARGEVELWIKASVTGKARKLEVLPPVVDFRTLRQPDTSFATDFFRPGDQLFVSFEAPEDGFLQLYIEDNGRIYQLLPYSGQSQSALNLRAGEPYILFSTDQAHNYLPNPHFVEDEIILTADRNDIAHHRLFAVFSPDALPLMRLDAQPGGKRSISTANFQQQLTRLRLARPGSVFVYATTLHVAPKNQLSR